MKIGIVKFFNLKRGFGYILSDTDSCEIFFHKSEIIEKINEGDKITFDESMSNRGKIAINIRKVVTKEIKQKQATSEFIDINESKRIIKSISEFKSEYSKYLTSKTVIEENIDYVLDVLFKFSVLGNQNKKRPDILYFKYMQTNMNLNRDEHLIVHRGLFKSLQII